MATVRQVCTDALRMIGMVGQGTPTPSAYLEDRAKDTLTNHYIGLIDRGAFGVLTDVLVDADYEAGENERLTITSATSVNITLPLTITPDGEDERAPRDCSVVVIGGETPARWLYDGNLTNWVALDGLTLDSAAPLSLAYPTQLAAYLAALLSGEFGRELSQVNARLAQQYNLAVTSQRSSPTRDVVITNF